MATRRRKGVQYCAVNVPSTTNEQDPSPQNSDKSRRSDASLLSWISWSWVSDLIAIGKQRPLTLDDIDEIEANHSAQRLLDRFLTSWRHEMNIRPKRPSLVRALHRTISPWKLWLPVISTIPGYAVMILMAICLRSILLFIEGADPSITATSAYYNCAGLSIATLWMAFHGNWLWFAAISNGIDVRVALTSAIIEKALKISSCSAESTRVINLLSADVQRFEDTLRIIVPTIVPPFFLILSFLYFAHTLSNWYCLMGLLLFVALIPMQLCFGLKFGALRDQAVMHSDERLRIVNEAVIGALVTKMYCWEHSLRSLVHSARSKEMKYIRRSAMLRSVNKALYSSSQCLLILMIFVPFYYSNGVLDVSVIYPILAVYTSLKIPLLWFIPYC